MSTFIDQDFESFPVGPTLVPGFQFGGGTILSPGANGSSKCFFFSLLGGIRTVQTVVVTSVSIFFWLRVNPDNPILSTNFLELASVDPVSKVGPAIFSLGFETDNSISCTSVNKRAFGNSGVNGVPAIQRDRWTFIQCNVQFDIYIDPITFLQYLMVKQCDLNIEGQPAIVAVQAVTNLQIGSLPVLFCNSYQFSGFQLFGGGRIDSITISDLVALNQYPHPGIPAGGRARVSELVAENAELPSSSLGRVSNLCIEVPSIPNRQARISQLVIEFMTDKLPPGFGTGNNVRIYES